MGLRSRHWKQRFSEDAEFVWNKSFLWNGETVQVGDPIPEELKVNRNRLKSYWESGAVALSGFQAPDVTTGRAPETEPEPEKDDNEDAVQNDGAFMKTMAQMGWRTTEAAPVVEQPETAVADWTKLGYQEQMALAREHGYKGGLMSKDKLAAYLEQHANEQPA